MKKVVNFIKDYWITALICVGFVLLYKYISDHKLFSALMFPPLKGILGRIYLYGAGAGCRNDIL